MKYNPIKMGKGKARGEYNDENLKSLVILLLWNFAEEKNAEMLGFEHGDGNWFCMLTPSMHLFSRT